MIIYTLMRPLVKLVLLGAPPIRHQWVTVIASIAFSLRGPATESWAQGLVRSDATPGALDKGFLDGMLDDVFQKAGVRAGAFALVRDGAVVYQKGYGVADAARSRAVDPELTVFRAASNGKVFVAVAAMLLEAQDKVDLRADVNASLKEFKLPATFVAPVTLEHLLTHTGGFEDRFLGGLAPTPETVMPLGEYLTKRMPARVSPPGRWMAYSNHGMALAGLVVQDASGVRFDNFVDERILRPLGMTRSSFRQPPPGPMRDALVWDPRGEGPWLNPYPAGSLVTTAADMGKFILALLGGPTVDGTPLLDPAVRDRMFARHYSAHPSMPGIAYGFFEGEASGHRTLHHTGDGGHHSLIWIVPEAHLGLFVVYTTPSSGSTDEPRARVVSETSARLYPQRPSTPLVPKSDAQARAARFVGIYRPNQLARTTIEKLAAIPAQITVSDPQDGTIHIALGMGADPESFVEVEPLLFRSPGGAFVAFTMDAGGRAAGLTGTAGTVDDPLSAERVGILDDSRLHLAWIVAATLIVASRLAVMLGSIAVRLYKRIQGRSRSRDQARTWVDGLGWRVSGGFALLCAGTPVVAVASIVALGGPVYQLPTACYVALVLVALVVLSGLTLVPLAVIAWIRRDGPVWKRVLLSLTAAVGAIAGPFAFYWNLLGFNV